MLSTIKIYQAQQEMQALLKEKRETNRELKKKMEEIKKRIIHNAKELAQSLSTYLSYFRKELFDFTKSEKEHLSP